MSGLDDEEEDDINNPVVEIVEEGISSIELAASSTYNRTYTPHLGEMKWFRDELEQLWVKFYTVEGRNLLCRVWPAEAVVQVVYDKGRLPD